MTFHNRVLAYVVGIIGAFLFTWPVAVLILFFFADVNGDFESDTSE